MNANPATAVEPTRAELEGHCREQLAELRALARELTEVEWTTPTLCDGWTAKDVYAHLLAGRETGLAGMAVGVLRHRGLDRWSDTAARRLASDTPTATLLDRFDRETSRWPERGICRVEAPAAKLADNVTHELDILRASGRVRPIPKARLAAALSASFRTNMWGTKSRVAGLRFVATDVDWAHGEGAEVTGPAEDLLLAINGRRQGLDALDGPGLESLRQRLG